MRNHWNTWNILLNGLAMIVGHYIITVATNIFKIAICWYLVRCTGLTVTIKCSHGGMLIKRHYTEVTVILFKVS